MADTKLSSGVAHAMPADLRQALLTEKSTIELWEDLTPLARNEWICWVISVKKPETRKNHVARTVSELKEGMRRPCCWAGCIHRSDKPMSPSQKWVHSRQSKK